MESSALSTRSILISLLKRRQNSFIFCCRLWANPLFREFWLQQAHVTFGSYSTRVKMQVLHLHTKTKFISNDTRMGLLLKTTSTVLDYWLHSTVLLKEQCPMWVMHLQCCGPWITQQPTRGSTIRVSTKLEELTLDEIESKMVVEARDIDL